MNKAFQRQVERRSAAFERFAEEVTCPLCDSDRVEEQTFWFACGVCGTTWKTKTVSN
jgi:ribosomal protein L37AE/L43A